MNSIVRNLLNRISLKKAAERLGGHLDDKDLWQEFSEATLKTQKYYLNQCKYMIIDISDIQKEYAEKMEGLAHVRDGSKDTIGMGYWLCNVAGINELGSLIVPCYSELYSLETEPDSENTKILNAIECCTNIVGKEKIWVMDRGGDRKTLIEPLLKSGNQFIIRQVGNRNLYCNGNKQSLRETSRMVNLTQTFKVTKRKKNKKIEETYDVGAIKVRLTKNGKDLYLVVAKERNKGYCWLLCHLDCKTEEEAIHLAFIGYGYRWKIEEVHRQIKSDYEIEDIRLQRYNRLKSINSLFWAVASFLYTRLESLSEEIIFHPELALVNRKNKSDLFRFTIYKLSFAVKKLLSLSKFHNKKTYNFRIKIYLGRK